MTKRFYRLTSLMVLTIIFSTSAYGQLRVGDTVSSQDLNATIDFCANDVGSTTLADLLQPPTQAIFLNFFASY